MAKVVIMEHPLIQHKLTFLRDKNTGSMEFRNLVSEIAMLMCYEATRDLPLEEVETELPLPLQKQRLLQVKNLLLFPFSVQVSEWLTVFSLSFLPQE